MEFMIEEIIEGISGLAPKARLVLPSGFVREEWKSLCFERGKSIIASAIASPKQIAQELVPESSDRLLEKSARVELLRENFRQMGLKNALPKLMEHRFRPKFYESLDRALQKGRELFVHQEEASIFEERLNEKNGQDERRGEFFDLNRFWDRLLELRDFQDESRLFELATDRLRAGARPEVDTIYWLHHFKMTPKVQFFFEELSKVIEVKSLHSSDFFKLSSESRTLERRLAHSMEDGAHFVMDQVLGGNPDQEIIVIEDRPEVRRTLDRIAKERGVGLQDARDPTILSHAEEMKTAILELELVARQFPRELVLTWLSTRDPSRGDLRRRIIESNFEQGLQAYRFDPLLYGSLSKLTELYPKRMDLRDLAKALEASAKTLALPDFVSKTLSSQIEEWQRALKQLGVEGRTLPIRYWLKELADRLRVAPPPVPPVRYERGVRLFRVDQAVSFSLPKDVRVHFFGVSTSFFEPREEATEWLSGRDLETLAHEFSLPNRKTKKETARVAFRSWVGRSTREPLFWEYGYDEQGTETESAELILRSFQEFSFSDLITLPVHPQVLPSLIAKVKPSPEVAKIKLEPGELPLGFVNALGNCAFTAYAQHLLKLYDERDPDFEIGNDVYGNLLHQAIETLLERRTDCSPDQAFQEAWAKTKKPAWLKSDRLFRAMKRRAILVLDHFLESENEYREKSGADLKSQEEEIELKREGFVFKGRMDRVDQHADGLVVVDYKTSKNQTGGQVSLEKGKGLQLAAYALALKDRDHQEVVSAQYVILAQDKINRNYGVLFKKWNKGKAADLVEHPLSFVKSNNTSLFLEEPDTVWRAFDDKIKGLLRMAQETGFKAEPADPTDCSTCRYVGVCGRGRAVLV